MRDKLKKIFSIENRTKYFTPALIFLCLASIIIFALLIIGNQYPNNQQLAKKEKINPFKDLVLEGKGIIVFDVINNRELFTQNADVSLPLASLTKVMTAVTLNTKFPSPTNIKIAKEFLSPEGDSRLIVGDIWQTKDLQDFTLLTSSNDGAFALAAVARADMAKENDPEILFIKAMNQTASEIGLSNSKFFNAHGLDREADRGGAYGSARDMAYLFAYTLKKYPDILEATRYKNLEFKSAEKNYTAENTNTIVDQIPNLIASKTGYTDLAGGNLVVAFDAGLNRPIIISILGSSAEGRFEDALKLVNATMKSIGAGY